MKIATVLFLALLLLPAVAMAGQFEDGMAAMDRPDFRAALKLWQPLADQGNARAQFWVGVVYEDGQVDENGEWTVQRDYAEAAKWFRKAADQGYARAQDSLSRMYDHGKGVPKDLSEAYFWNRLAAIAGYKISIDDSGAIAKHLNPEQRAAVEKRVQGWKPVVLQAICLSYADETILVGRVVAATFPGPPNYESIAKGDRAELDLFLDLSSPVCVDANLNGRKKLINVAIAKTARVQLAADGQNGVKIMKMVGHEANISGKLFGAFTGHHHAPVLIFVDGASLHE